MTLDEAQRLASRLRDQLGRAIIGQHAVVQDILTAFFAGGHCLLRGVPGLAKTLLIKTLARAIHLKFNRIQFTPDLMPSDIIGTEVIEEDRGTGRREDRKSTRPELQSHSDLVCRLLLEKKKARPAGCQSRSGPPAGSAGSAWLSGWEAVFFF